MPFQKEETKDEADENKETQDFGDEGLDFSLPSKKKKKKKPKLLDETDKIEEKGKLNYG